MKKIVPYMVFGVVLMVLATLSTMANEAFKGRIEQTATGGTIEFTNTLGRLGIASAFLSGSFSAGNTSTISVVTGPATNELVSAASLRTVAWSDQGGAVQMERDWILRFEWTETATPASITFSSFPR